MIWSYMIQICVLSSEVFVRYACEFENLVMGHFKCEKQVNDLIAAIPANVTVLFCFYFYVRPFMIRGNAGVVLGSTTRV